MGVVYRARHVLIDRVVAVKLIRPDLRGETHLRAWMLREARAANRVDHAHIIDIHDIVETEESELYLVMEYLVGTSLSSELARGATPLARSVDILEQMCAALARAHDLGVVHRDLKSDNILLTTRGGRKDFVKILDFGLAHLAMDPRLAPKGAVFGTPEYMAPEQARGEEATAPERSSTPLGVLFFEMVTGQLPFRSDDRDTLLEDAANGHRAAPAVDQARGAAGRRVDRDAAPRERPAKAVPGRPPPPRRAQIRLQRSHAEHAPWDVNSSGENPRAAAASPTVSPGVIEWASRAALFSRMVSRAYPGNNAPPDVQSALGQTWDLASRATRLEGEVATHTRKLEALERAARAGAASGDRSQGRGARPRRIASPSRTRCRAGRRDTTARRAATGRPATRAEAKAAADPGRRSAGAAPSHLRASRRCRRRSSRPSARISSSTSRSPFTRRRRPGTSVARSTSFERSSPDTQRLSKKTSRAAVKRSPQERATGSHSKRHSARFRCSFSVTSRRSPRRAISCKSSSPSCTGRATPALRRPTAECRNAEAP